MAQFGGDASMPIAVIGMGCRFPGDATSPDHLWEMLVNGRNAWSEFPKDRINIDGFYHPSGNREGSICFKGGHFLKEDVAAWDAPFFSTTAHEAAAMDPQQRILLEVSYEAFENAGIPMESLPGSSTAVYCGSFVKGLRHVRGVTTHEVNDDLDYEQIVLRDPDDSPQYAATGNGIAIMSNRISWFYDLRGPSMTLDTGCSASLVGVHLACQSLRAGESTMAMAMGAGLILTPATMMPMTALNFLSPDGKCFTFDERANGYGRGEGLGAIILKPLEAALRDNDTIRAVIRGSGVNQDGRTPGITMPSKEAQALNIRAVYKAAGLGYDRTAYFEAHGTGTQAGDPKELGAISETFAETRNSELPMYVGSVKTNIGHLEGCAGIAGIIKGILILENGLIPPNLYFEKVNPNIDLEGWKIKVPTSLTKWPIEGLRRVSINCFGFGGTNAHIILDDAHHYLDERGLKGNHCSVDVSPSPTPSLVDSGVGLTTPPLGPSADPTSVLSSINHKLFVLSSHEEHGIARLSTEYSKYLGGISSETYEEEAEKLATNLAYTLACRRSKLSWKAFVVSSSIQKLSSQIVGGLSKPFRSSQPPNVAFVFSGQGAQWFGMGRELLQHQQFLESVEAADAFMKTIGSEWSVMTELLKDERTSIISLPRISQPLCTALQVALVDLLRHWGVQPYAVVGHSSGEIAAAYAVGAISRKDAWKLAFHRGRLTSSIKDLAPCLRGRMMAVALSKETAKSYLEKLTSSTAIVACINSPDNVTISGDESAVLELEKVLVAEGIFARLLKVENAYHSSHMKVIEQHYLDAIKDIQTLDKSPGKIMFSSVTGQSVTGQELGPDYWARNMVSPVRFSEAVHSLMRSKVAKPDFLLELGPHSVLQGPLKQILDVESNPKSRPSYLSMLLRGKDAVATALDATGHLWASGYPLNLEKVNESSSGESPRVLTDLPTYSWNHSKTYWYESHIGKSLRFSNYGRQDLIGRPTADSTIFEPRWRGFIRVSENPWVQDHQVQNTIIYPAAGMMAMVLEGAQQIQGSDHLVEGYKISKMFIDKAMIIPTSAHGLETSLSMKRHESDASTDDTKITWFDFAIYSKLLDAAWQKNSSGLLGILYKTSSAADQLQLNEYTSTYSTYQDTCIETISPRQLYETLESIGMKYGPLFQNITSVQKKDMVSCTTVRIPDTLSRMPSKYEYPHLIHPATLDAMFQTVFVAGNEPMVPSFLENMFISVDFPRGVGAELKGYSSASREGFRDAVGNVVMSDGSWDKPKLIVKNLHFTALSTAPEELTEKGFLPNHHNMCAELVWKEDLDTADVSSLSEWIDLISYKDPALHILDTCEGTGDLTLSLVKMLGAGNDSTPRYSRYIFANPTSEGFEQLRGKLGTWSSYVELKELDPKTELSKQGFKERSFDLLFASNIDPNYLATLRSLVKPQGRLILIDLKPSSVPAVDLDSLLSDAGFSDVEHTLKDDITSKAGKAKIIVPDLKPSIPAPLASREILVLLPNDSSPKLHSLSSRLIEALQVTGAKASPTTLVNSSVSFSGKVCLALLELDAPLLRHWSNEEFDAFRSMVSDSKGCLWVTKGGQRNAKVPLSAPIFALFRTIRSEDPQKLLFTLDLDAASDLGADATGRAVVSTMLKSFDPFVKSEEMEYAECDGKLFIPRVILEDQLGARIERGEAQRAPQLLPFAQADRPLELEVGTLGKLDSLYFNDDPTAMFPLGPQDIEIRIQAVGVNPVDVQTALGRTSRDTIGSDAAGIITRVGPSVSKFNPGERVVTIVPGAFKTVVRCQENMAHPIPKEMTFEVAASLPTDYLTAYYAIITVGRLEKGESLLLHTGACPFGQAAAQIARHLDAETFVTVNTQEERQIAVETYGIQESHIFNGSSKSIAAESAERGGFDLILNCFDGEVRSKALSCVGEYGRFVDVNIDSSASTVASRDVPHIPNVTYSTVDIGNMLNSKTPMMSRLLQSTFKMIQSNFAQKLSAVKSFTISEILKAFQEEHEGKHNSKIVVTIKDDDMVPVVPRDEHPLKLSDDATYVLVGGLGGLGRSLSGLLVKHGAKNLAFFSRSGATSEQQQKFLQDLKQESVQARVFKCDITDETQLDSAIQKCTDEMPPIRGVIQAAAVIRDAIFDNMTYTDWVLATRPKIQGSNNLHNLMPKDLDFFVFLSSSAGVIGARGQANYAAGNGFQDALAMHRRKKGMKAVSLDLGPILGAGMVAEDDATLDILRASGFLNIREKDFHLLVISAITGYSQDSHPIPPQIIIGTATGGITKQNSVPDPYWHDTPSFSIIRKVDLGPPTTSSTSGLSSLSIPDLLSASATLSEATGIVTEGLAMLLSRSMNMLPTDLDTKKPANAYGVDSLVAVGTRNWIFRETGVDVSVFEILSEMGVEELAEMIAMKSRFVAAELKVVEGES